MRYVCPSPIPSHKPEQKLRCRRFPTTGRGSKTAEIGTSKLPLSNLPSNLHRLDGPTLMMLRALVLVELLGAHLTLVGLNSCEATFLLLAMLHAVIAMRLPGRVSGRG